jgi:ferredoxin-thioredoxin reductase catalytic subunit
MAEEATPQDTDAYRREITERIEAHVKATGYRLNPSEKAVEALIGGLVKRKVNFGDYYCPCRVVTGDAETDEPNVCPCASHEAEIAANGKCHCALFFAAEEA